MYVDENMENIKGNEDHTAGSQGDVDNGNSKSKVCFLLKRESDVIENDEMIGDDDDDENQVQCGLNKSVKLDVKFARNIVDVSVTNKSHCSVDAGSHHSVDDGSHCSVDDGSHCSVDDGSHCSVDDGSHCSVDDGRHCSIDDGTHYSVDDVSHCIVDAGSHCSVDDVSNCGVDDGSNCSVDGSNCSVDDGNHCSEDNGSTGRVVVLSVSNNDIMETSEGNHESNSNKMEYLSTEHDNEKGCNCFACGGRLSQTNNHNANNFIHIDNKAHKICDSCKYNLTNYQFRRSEGEIIINREVALSNGNKTYICCEVRNIKEAEDVEMSSSFEEKKPATDISIVVQEVPRTEKLCHLASVCSKSNKDVCNEENIVLKTVNKNEDEVEDAPPIDVNIQLATDSDSPEKSHVEASTQTDFHSEETNVILINIIKRLQETISGPEISHEGENTKSEENEKSDKKHYQCTICNKTFQHKRSMKDHENAHKGERPYCCTICNESFSRRTSLQQHRSVHSDVKLHRCDICEKAFSRKYDLKNHQLVHTGEQPYKCELCLKSFKRRHGLNRHMLLHTEGASYTCELCEITFNKKSAFNKHQSLHKDGACGSFKNIHANMESS